jgi:hypothetical protein
LIAQALRALERVLTRRGGHDPAIEDKMNALRKQLMKGMVH